MGKLDKAKDLYLRGFNSKYIKRRTDISMQSLLKQLLSAGEVYTKDDIITYQIRYIRSKYTNADIESAYHEILSKYSNKELDRAKKGHTIECLGCGFGDYPKVFRELLGLDRYNKLRNEVWKLKQTATVHERYGVNNVFQKESFNKFVSHESIKEAREKRTATMLDRYGVREPNQVPEFKNRAIQGMHQTMMAKYGVENMMQIPEVAARSADKRQKVMMERYGAGNSVQVERIRNMIFENRRKNGTLNASRPEDALYLLLVEHFGEDNVKRNAIVDSRYPWHVDFYIVSMDLFIELNGDRGHNTHWYDPDNVNDRQTVESWTKNMLRIEMETGKKSRYRKYIETWTVTDVKKRNCARLNKLCYLVFWDGSSSRGIPNLRDAKEWINAGCPLPANWHEENTYGIAKDNMMTI